MDVRSRTGEALAAARSNAPGDRDRRGREPLVSGALAVEIGGGDRDEIVRMAEFQSAGFHYRAPLVVAWHQALTRLGGPLGFSGATAIRVTSALAGGLFVLLVVRASRSWWFRVPLLATGTLMVFWGHIETYAPAYTAALAFLLVGVRYARGEPVSFGWVCAAWVLACGCHMANVFYLPALVVLAYSRDRKALDWIVWAVVAMGIVFLTAPFLTTPFRFDTLTIERLTPPLSTMSWQPKLSTMSWHLTPRLQSNDGHQFPFRRKSNEEAVRGLAGSTGGSGMRSVADAANAGAGKIGGGTALPVRGRAGDSRLSRVRRPRGPRLRYRQRPQVRQAHSHGWVR
jgi:hypothetical protein